MANFWEDIKNNEPKQEKVNFWEDVYTPKPEPIKTETIRTPTIDMPKKVDINQLQREHNERLKEGKTFDSAQYQVDEFYKFINNNDAEGLKKRYGFDLDKLKQDENAFNQALSDVANYEFTKLKRWNTIKDNSEKGNGFTKFFDKISQAGASTFMGEKVPEHYKITSGNKAADIGADIVGSIGGFATPVAGGESLLSAGTKASQGLIPKLSTKVTKPALKKAINSPLGHRILEGGATGVVVDVGQGIKEGDSPVELGKRVGEGFLFGAGLDVAGYGLGKLGHKLAPELKNLAKSKVLDKIEVYADDGIESTVKETGNLTPELKNLDEVAATSTKPLTPEVKASDEVAITSTPLTPEIEPGQKLRRTPLTVADSPTTSAELKKLIEENPNYYNPTTNKAQMEVADEIINSNPEIARSLVLNGEKFSSDVEPVVAQKLLSKLQSEGRFDDALEILEATSKKYTMAGKQVQTGTLWRRMTPEGMTKYAHKVIEQANNILPDTGKIKVSPEFLQEIDGAMRRIQDSDVDFLKLIEEQANGKIPKLVNKELKTYSEDKLKDVAIAQVLSKISDQVPVETAQKVSTFQAMSHLLNVKTFLRNIFGNTTFGAAELGSNTYATLWDKLLYKGKNVALPQLKGSVEEGKKRAKDAIVDIALGIDRRGISAGKYEIPKGQTFKKGVLSKAERALKYSLTVPDEFAKGWIGKNTRQQLELLGGFKESEIDEIVKGAELYSTFQDNSLPARMLKGLKDICNMVGVGKTVRGPGGLSTKEFGVGDFLIKYTTVPGNIISRSFEYSPGGFLKALKMLYDGKALNKIGQREISMTLGRATNGSLMIGTGILLNRLGLITSEDKDRDSDARALERAEGLGNNKINISGIGRLLNGEDPKPQKGDILESFNWLEPVRLSFSVGAIVDNQFKKEKRKRDAIFKSGSIALEEMLDIPTLSVIRKMTYADGIFDKAVTPITEGVSGFVPAPIRQLAQATDANARDTYSSDPIERAKKRIIGNIPGARKSLMPRISPLGDEIKYPNDTFNSFINPATTSIYNPSSLTPKLKALEDTTGETSFYPDSKSIKDFTYRKEKIELTEKERTEFQRMAGQLTKESYERILGNKDIGDMSDASREALVKRLENAKKKARDKAKMEMLKKRGSN